MATDATRPLRAFDPTAFEAFRFVSRSLDERGRVRLGYALDEEIAFVEEFDLPLGAPLADADRGRVEGLLSLLHWVAGVSYFKVALPRAVRCETGAPGPAVAQLREGLYSEALAGQASTAAGPWSRRPPSAARACGPSACCGPRSPSCAARWRCSLCCAPRQSWRSRARSRAWSATTARSRAAPPPSGPTRHGGRRP